MAAGLFHQALLCWPAMLALAVAGTVRQLHVARFVRTTGRQGDDVIEARGRALNGLPADLAHAPVTLPDRRKANRRNERLAQLRPPAMLVLALLQSNAFRLQYAALASVLAQLSAMPSTPAAIRQRVLGPMAASICSGAGAGLIRVLRILLTPRFQALGAVLSVAVLPVLKMRSVVIAHVRLLLLAMGSTVGGTVAAIAKPLRPLTGFLGPARRTWQWGSMRLHDEAPSRCAAPRDVPASPRHFHVHFSMEGA